MIYQPMIEMKRCSKGEACVNPRGPWLPATRKHFYHAKKANDGLFYTCITCEKKRAAEYNHANRSHINNYNRQWRANNPHKQMKHSQKHKEWLAANKDRTGAKTREWRKNHSDRVKETKRRDYLKNSERYKQNSKEWRKNNKDRADQRSRDWIKKNPERRREIARRYVKKHPDTVNVNTRVRRARRRTVALGFSPSDWQRALDYFGGCCAVCGRPPGLWHTLAMDHWIAVTDPRPDNPGTVPDNIVPLCNGVDGCNNSKSNRDAAEWLITKLGPIKGKAKLKEIQAYLDSRKDEAGK